MMLLCYTVQDISAADSPSSAASLHVDGCLPNTNLPEQHGESMVLEPRGVTPLDSPQAAVNGLQALSTKGVVDRFICVGLG